MSTRVVAQVFPPGEFIREEMEARGWSQVELAKILGRPPQSINELLAGKRGITPDMAHALAEAFGTSAEMWMNLESAYRLAQAGERDQGIAKRAALYSKAPVNEMVKRGWIEDSGDVATLESNVLQFLGIASIDDEPSFAAAARKSTGYDEPLPAQNAWLCRAKQMAENLPVDAQYSKDVLGNRLSEIRALAQNPEEIRKLPALMASLGIRLVIIEQLPKSKIDGAAFWLNKHSPIIALSMRYDRIDCFWHTFVHELAHIWLNHASIDANLVGADRKPVDESEKEVDALACSFLVPPEKLLSFISRTRPLYSKVRIVQFSNSIEMHPGVVVGQLQHRGEIGYQHSREMLVKVKHLITATAYADGWGTVAE